jgi:transglutaminase-like putative cysteine protease
VNTNRSLRWVASALAVWSFTALVATRQLTWIPVILVYALYAAWFLRGDVFHRVSPLAWRLINVFVALVALLAAKYDLGNTLVYGTTYLAFQKLVTARTARDHIYLFWISTFQVVLAAVISEELSFLVVLLGFLVLVIVAMTLLTLERGRLEVEQSNGKVTGVGWPVFDFMEHPASGARPPAPAVSDSILTYDFLWRTTAACLIVILVSTFFFITIPRFAVRRFFWRLRPFDSEFSTGFSGQVTLGGMSEIFHNRTIVMRVRVNQQTRSQPIPRALRMRGLALGFFDGRGWQPLQRLGVFEQVMPRAPALFSVPFNFDSRRSVWFDIEQDLRQTNWLFGPPFVAELIVDRPTGLHYHPEPHAFEVVNTASGWLSYHVQSYLESPDEDIVPAAAVQANPRGRVLPRLMGPYTPYTQLRGSPIPPDLSSSATLQQLGWAMTTKALKIYTALPEGLARKERIQALAEDLTRATSTPLERVNRLNRFFREQFRYALVTGETAPGEYLARFLLDRREGHCETFATAMAVLCRMLGIPSRVVSGFYSSEYNRYGKFFYVRQSHAHAWVEVWLDGYGWLTVDPTPPSALSGDTGRLAALLAVVSDYWDSWTVLWRRYIVEYNLLDQLQLLGRLRNRVHLPGLSLSQHHSLSLWHSFQEWIAQAQRAGRARGYPFHTLSLAGLIVVWVVYRRQQRRNGRQPKNRRAAACPVDFYGEILAALSGAGWQRRPDETPAEFARAVGARQPELTALLPITDTYYRVRFNGGSLQPDERASVTTLLSTISKSHSRRR